MSLIITENIQDKIFIKSTSKIQKRCKYILNTIDLDIIEYFYIHNINLYITNINIEYLRYKTSRFKYLEIEIEPTESEDRKEIYKNKINNTDIRGIEISFNSDVYKSIYTSLICSKSYFYSGDVNTEIFEYIKNNQNVTLRDLESNVTGDIKKGLNNLLYTEVIVKKNNNYKINDLLNV